jgi:DUF1680 family protein
MNTENFTILVPLKQVSINDRFWNPVMERVRTDVILHQWEALNDRLPDTAPSYCMRNFKLAAQMTHPGLDYGVAKDAGFGGPLFQDSDFAKWLEAVSYSLVWRPDPGLECIADEAITIVCNAQQEDGYLNTYFIISGPEKRFSNFRDCNELYCLGHFIEGAAAYFEATGKRKLLDAVIRYVNLVETVVGPEENKLHAYPGHPVIEMALVKLYRITKTKKYLDLAEYFIRERGKAPLYFEEELKKPYNKFVWHDWRDSWFKFQYYQAGMPVREQRTAQGHAVRAVYLYSGIADVARETGDDELLEVSRSLWNDIAFKQMYITGAVGQSAHGEAFSFDYDLPNDAAYAETCAAIGLAFFSARMLSIEPKAVYADVIERLLFNGIICGMSLDGKSYFYTNPLEVFPEASLKNRDLSHVSSRRHRWFGCACCPPNLARIIASLGNYIHSAKEGCLYTHQYIGSESRIVMGENSVVINMDSGYPWDGTIHITIRTGRVVSFTYGLRIPLWCGNYDILCNDKPVEAEIVDGYAHIKREWADGDTVCLDLDMPVEEITANPKVRQDINSIAVTRGPIVYCAEEVDNGRELFRIAMEGHTEFTASYEKDLLGGVTTIRCGAKRRKEWPSGQLYQAVQKMEMEYEDIKLKLIPYFAWANRAPGEMRIWLNR